MPKRHDWYLQVYYINNSYLNLIADVRLTVDCYFSVDHNSEDKNVYTSHPKFRPSIDTQTKQNVQFRDETVRGLRHQAHHRSPVAIQVRPRIPRPFSKPFAHRHAVVLIGKTSRFFQVSVHESGCLQKQTTQQWRGKQCQRGVAQEIARPADRADQRTAFPYVVRQRSYIWITNAQCTAWFYWWLYEKLVSHILLLLYWITNFLV